MPCKDICVNFKTVKTVTWSPYLEGEKWCRACCIFIKWEGIHCPCCTRKLRVNPRSKRSWCYATLRSIRLSQDDSKLVKGKHYHDHKLNAAHTQREKILVMGRDFRNRRVFSI